MLASLQPSKETAPTPTDSKVKLLSVPSSTCAVRQFTWGCTMETAEKRKDELVEWIEKDGSWEVDGEWVLNRCVKPRTLTNQPPKHVMDMHARERERET